MSDENPDQKQDGELTKHQRAELLFKAAGFCWERFDKRSAIVWKIYFSVWTALAVLTGFILTGQIEIDATTLAICSTLFVTAVLVVQCIYIYEQGVANRTDRNQFHEYYSAFQSAIDFEHSDTVKDQISTARRKSPSLWQYANRFSWLVTVLLGATLILASLVSGHKTFVDAKGQQLSTGNSSQYWNVANSQVSLGGNEVHSKSVSPDRVGAVLQSPGNDTDFSFVKLVLAVVTGLIVVFLAELWKNWRDRRKKRRAARKMWIDYLNRNKDLLVQMKGEMSDDTKLFAPSYQFDLISLDSSLNSLFELFNFSEEFAEIDLARFQMMHMNSKLKDIRTFFVIHSPKMADPSTLRLFAGLIAGARGQLDETQKSMDCALKILKLQLKR